MGAYLKVTTREISAQIALEPPDDNVISLTIVR